tara:strand:+ start:1831 stop:2229 length:399 start_codon:yes stop_codon:yes gene_type:complete
VPVFSRLKDVITSLGTPEAVSLERTNTAGGSNDEGVWMDGSKSVRPLAPTVVHPISGRDRNLLPEGVRTRETIVTFATEVLRTETDFKKLADVLLYRAEGEAETNRYVVQTVENWHGPSGHWRVFSTREPRG